MWITVLLLLLLILKLIIILIIINHHHHFVPLPHDFTTFAIRCNCVVAQISAVSFYLKANLSFILHRSILSSRWEWKEGPNIIMRSPHRLMCTHQTRQQCGRRCRRSCSSPFQSSTEPNAPRVWSVLGFAAASPTLSGATMWHKGRRWWWTTEIKDCKFTLGLRIWRGPTGDGTWTDNSTSVGQFVYCQNVIIILLFVFVPSVQATLCQEDYAVRFYARR